MTTKPTPPSRSADQFVVRLPDGMRDLIAKTAKEAGRSMNAEIIARLQQTFNDPKDRPLSMGARELDDLAEKVAGILDSKHKELLKPNRK